MVGREVLGEVLATTSSSAESAKGMFMYMYTYEAAE